MPPVEDEWISVTAAAQLAGCSEQYIRRDLLAHVVQDENGLQRPRTSGGRLEGWMLHGRAWLVSRQSAIALRNTLTSRARARRPAIKPRARPCRRKTLRANPTAASAPHTGEYLQVSEAAAVMRCTERQVRDLLKAKRIPGARRVGGRFWAIPIAAARLVRDDLAAAVQSKARRATHKKTRSQ